MDSEFWDLYGEWGNGANGEPLPLTVRTKHEGGSLGDRLDAAVSKPGLPRMPVRRLVRTSTGREVITTTTVYAPPSYAPLFTLGSQVDLGDGQGSRTVAQIDTADALGFTAGLGVHLE